MAKEQTTRLRPAVLREDTNTLAAIATPAPAYVPANAAYSLANLTTAQTAMTTALAAASTSEWAVHPKALESRKQVAAQ